MSKKKQYKDVIGLIHPSSARHHRSNALCNNPDVIVTKLKPIHSNPSWYTGEFMVLKPVDIFIAGETKVIHGFRPCRVLVK